MNLKTFKAADKPTFQWDLRALRLPKMIEADPRSSGLLSNLAAHSRLLWPQGAITVPEVALSPDLTEVLKNTHKAGRIVRGLENAEIKLAAEERGLDLADQQSSVLRGVRVSRLLILADNGSERFYRQVEKLLRRHGQRILVLHLNAGAEVLGEMLFGPGRRVLLLMLDHKEAVSAVLLSLAGPSDGSWED